MKTPGRCLRAFVFLFLLVAAAGTASAQLVVSLEANPDPAAPGQRVNVALHVSNAGVSTLSSVTVSLPLPAQVDNFGVSLSDGAACNTGPISNGICERGESMVWSLGTLLAGEEITVHIPPVIASGVDTPADGTIISFVATVSATGVSAVQRQATVEVQSAATLSLSLAESVDPVAPGAELSYVLHFGQAADGPTTPNATLVAPLPAGTTFVSANGGGTLNGSQVEWSLGDLSPGEAGTRAFTVLVGGGLADGSLLDANATLLDPTVSGRVVRARAVTPVDVNRPIAITHELLLDPVAPGETSHSLLTVTNRSSSTLASIRLEMRLPDYLDTVGTTLADAATCNTGPVSNGICERGEQMFWTLGTLDPGEGVTITIPPLVSATGLVAPDGEQIVFDAYVDNTTTAETLASIRRTTEVQSSTTLSLSMAASLDPVAPGAELSYALHFGQAVDGPTTANATLVAPLPTGTTFVSATGGGVLNGSQVEWSLGDLSPGEAGTRSLTVTVGAGLPEGTLLDAKAILSDPTVNGRVARARAATRVDVDRPIAITHELLRDPVAPGETSHSLLTVTNRSSAALTGIRLELRLPDYLDTVGVALADTATCNTGPVSNGICERGEQMFWTLGTLDPGEGVTITIPPLVSTTGLVAPDGEQVVFDAYVDNTTTASTLASVRRTAEVQSSTTLSLSMAESLDPVAPGAELSYVLHFGQAADGPTTPNATLAAPLPAGTTFVSATGGGVLNGSQVAWSLGDLSPGEAGTRSLTVTVGAGLPEGTLLDAQATLSDASVNGRVARARAATRVDLDRPIEITHELLRDPVAPGETSHSLLTVSNRSSAALTGIRLEMRLPDYLDTVGVALADTATCNTGPANNLVCERGEQMFWTLGTLEPGEGQTITVPPLVSTSGLVATDGEQIVFDALVDSTATASTLASVRRTAEVQTGTTLSLSMAELTDPVDPGVNVIYTLHFGQAADGPTTPNAALVAQLPAGTTFVSATGGGVLNGSQVEWSLGDLSPGKTGTRSLTVLVGAGLPEGTLLDAQTVLSDGTLNGRVARARAATRVDINAVLGVEIETTPTPAIAVQPGDQIVVGQRIATSIVVTNRSGLTVNSVLLSLRLPDHLDTFSTTAADGGVCNTAPANNAVCERSEEIVWTLSSLAAGATSSVDISPLVSVTGFVIEPGELIQLFAVARELGTSTFEATDKVAVPEPGRAIGLGVGAILLLAGARCRGGRTRVSR